MSSLLLMLPSPLTSTVSKMCRSIFSSDLETCRGSLLGEGAAESRTTRAELTAIACSIGRVGSFKPRPRQSRTACRRKKPPRAKSESSVGSAFAAISLSTVLAKGLCFWLARRKAEVKSSPKALLVRDSSVMNFSKSSKAMSRQLGFTRLRLADRGPPSDENIARRNISNAQRSPPAKGGPPASTPSSSSSLSSSAGPFWPTIKHWMM
mmetsp:Transcript_77753/g.251881  ORF Transcript_77753/g.251881 Transcript_77753/m.251881 type:complete len:208 (+) Transcript_77753:3098-3721(+)